jgi:hypothetical protein
VLRRHPFASPHILTLPPLTSLPPPWQSSKFYAEKELKEQAALEAKGQAAKMTPATLDAVVVQA